MTRPSERRSRRRDGPDGLPSPPSRSARTCSAAAADGKTEGGTVPAEITPDDVVQTQQQLRILPWITPVLTGALVVLGAQQGEQQRPGQRIRSWRKSVA